MHRSASKVIKHASRLTGKPPSISPIAARIKTATTPVQKNLSLALLTRAASSSSATTNPLSYDQIMSSGSVSSTSDEMSSSIISSTPYSTFSSSLSEADLLPPPSSSTEPTTQQQQAVQHCYENSDDEYLTPPMSTSHYLEDYDRYELHHPPCEKVKVSYDTSWGLGLGW